MIVRNWMTPNPKTVTGDTLVSQAKRILHENNLRALPVVDDEGRLRGLLTRVGCLRAAEFVTRTQDPHEFEYFANRLKVKDLMVRTPYSVSPDESIEACLRHGHDEKLGQVPVVKDGKLVGLVSANELLYLAAQVLGAWQHRCGITVGPLEIEAGTLGKIAQIMDTAGAVLEGMFAVRMSETGTRKRVIIRFTGVDAQKAAGALTAAGFNVLEVSSSVVSESNGGRNAH